ncbi:MAG: C1 family peptidase [Chamaesiphon sp.]
MPIIKSYGWKKDKPDPRDFKYSAPVEIVKSLPSAVDLRGLLPPPYDQGQLGSCTANATAAAFEFCQRKEKLFEFIPSRLFIYWNTRDLEGDTQEDAGGELRDAAKAIGTYGVCPEKVWPYEIARFAAKPSIACYTIGRFNKAIAYHSVPQTLEQMRGCLAEGYPFTAGIMVYEGFESSSTALTGVVELPHPGEQQIGGHAILVVGYQDNSRIFICRNSWGTDWGQQGYFTIPYDYLTNPDLASDFWTIRIVR